MMGTYNVLKAVLKCPRCGRTSLMDVDLYFGYRNQIALKVGDCYPWAWGGRSVKKGGRPPLGDIDGEGYTECPNCKKDFFVIVRVRGGRIVEALPDLSKKPYIPD